MSEKIISNLIQSQFPDFYKEDGPVFISFVQAYYEWMESLDKNTISFSTPKNFSYTSGNKVITKSNASIQNVVLRSNEKDFDVIGGIYNVGDTLYEVNEVFNITGTVTMAADTITINGTNTLFTQEIKKGSHVLLDNELFKVKRIVSDSRIDVDTKAVVAHTNVSAILYNLINKSEILSVVSNPGVIGKSRSLLDYRDIDTTLDSFVTHFQQKYLNSIPQQVLADKRMLVKHIKDLYKAKGTRRAYELLFRIIFNEDMDVYIPAENIFKTSEAEWFVPHYVEVTDSPFLDQMVGFKIFGTKNGTTAIVESVYRKMINNRLVVSLIVSSLNGTFSYGEQILCQQIPTLTIKDAPIVIGSLSSVGITNGGINYNPGDVLDVLGNGSGGKVRVVSTRNENGKITFTLHNGGSGFTMNPNITVDGGFGSGASFHVGGLVDKEIFNINTDSIEDYLDTVLEVSSLGYDLTVTNVVGSGFSNTEYITATANTVMLDANVIGVLTVGETVSNTTTGFSGTVINTQDTYILLVNPTGSVGAGDILISNTSGSILSINSTYAETVEANAHIFVANSTHVQANSCFTFSNTGLVIDTVAITSGGSLYANDDMVFFTGGGGSDAAGLVTTDANGTIVQVDIRSEGSGYSSTPTAFVETSNTVSGVTILASGFGYANGEALTVSGDGSGARGRVFTDGAGMITSVIIDDRGSGYSAATIDVATTGGLGASLAAVIPSGANLNAHVLRTAGNFVPTMTITGSNTGTTAMVSQVTRLTDWNFPSNTIRDRDNLDTLIELSLTYEVLETGTISFITDINPGSGYSQSPTITIIEPHIFALNIPDGSGGTKGFNAIVLGKAGSGNGVVTAVSVIDSGFGYLPNENLNFKSANNEAAVTGTAVVDQNGIGTGYWKDAKSVMSGTMYIQDSFYYQNFSYEIIATRMLDTYKTYVKDIIHPCGIALFGRYAMKDEYQEAVSTIAEESITQV